jgi:hypothetical protein
MGRPCSAAIGACMVLGLTAGAAAREEVPALARLRFEGRTSPTIYVRYQDRQLWVAPSFDALRTVKPLRLMWTKTWSYQEEDVHWRERRYAEVRLAGRIGRFSEVRMRPIVSVGLVRAPKQGEREPEPQSNETLVSEVHFLCRDGAGDLWDYVGERECWLTRTAEPAKARLAEIRVPDPARLGLVLRPRPGKGAVGIPIQAKAGPAEIYDARRNGKGLPVHVVVKRADGEAAHSAVGGLGGSQTQRWSVTAPASPRAATP